MHIVKEHIFIQAQCQGVNFTLAQCQGAYFSEAQCQKANFTEAQCQGACFNHAQCQGAYFYETQCKGAYAGDGYIEFKDRIGKKTELKTMQFAGELAPRSYKKDRRG